MALSNLKRHKSRTFLTVLGIVIGTISVIMMVALGLGMQENFSESIDNMGSIDIITVTKGDNTNSTTRLAEDTSTDVLTSLDLALFAEIEYIEAVSPVISKNVKLVSGKYEALNTLIGIDMALFNDLGFVTTKSQDVVAEKLGIVFGQTAAENFEEVEKSNVTGANTSQFGEGMRVGQGRMPNGGMMGGMPGRDFEVREDESLDVDVFSERITMSLDTSYSPMNQTSSTSEVYRIQGNGLLEEGDNTRDRNMYIDIETLVDLIEEAEGESIDGYDSAYLKISDTSYIDIVVNYLENYGYEASTMAEMVETIQSTTTMLQIALGAIGGISLLVAAIGIMNTMIMAITERKREIGVMKVIGATIQDIKRLFLLEAALIGFVGGVVGVGISFLLTVVFTSDLFGNMATGGGGGAMSMSFSLPEWLILVGVIFTTFVGIVSGYIPAKKAMACSALEALQSQ
jgi:ABC-type antimicrobial peptide transport system permease subunit